jgi:uncharacterized UBP type Zn finger protein
MWISVPVVCCVNDIERDDVIKLNSHLENLGISLKELPPEKTEVRTGELDVSKITMYYPSNDGNRTIVECINSDYSIDLTFKNFKLRIEEALKVNG